MRTIQVAQEDINNGQRGCVSACPIALAAERAGLRHPCVGRKTLRVADNHRAVYLPEEAIRFIEDFDEHGMGCPFSFEIDI